MLAYLKRNKLGKFSKEEQERRELQKKEEEEAEAKKLENLSVGARCEVSVPGQPTRRAAIRFIGEFILVDHYCYTYTIKLI